MTPHPTLSLILCSRNDQYMGDSRWRLETALNYVARRVDEGGWRDRVEIIVADWGSEVPLRDAVNLVPSAAAMVSFVEIPPALARERQRDSPFAEVIALNSAARRSRGAFIGRIDQDTLIGSRFFERFFALVDDPSRIATPLDQTLFFSNLRMVPYRFAARCPPLTTVERFVATFGDWAAPENSRSRDEFYIAGVGIWLLHRDRWEECGGYDERMIYMNAMETNMIRRLLLRYPIVDLGAMTDRSFYHLEHYHPYRSRKSGVYRKSNPHRPFAEPDVLRVNDDSWGLVHEPLLVRKAIATAEPQTLRRLGYVWTVGCVATQLAADATVLFPSRAWTRWTRRARLAARAVSGQPVGAWPRVLRDKWRQRPSRAA